MDLFFMKVEVEYFEVDYFIIYGLSMKWKLD
jgi:hypothetical protein